MISVQRCNTMIWQDMSVTSAPVIINNLTRSDTDVTIVAWDNRAMRDLDYARDSVNQDTAGTEKWRLYAADCLKNAVRRERGSSQAGADGIVYRVGDGWNGSVDPDLSDRFRTHGTGRLVEFDKDDLDRSILLKREVPSNPDPEEAIRNQERTIAAIDDILFQKCIHHPLGGGRRTELLSL